MPGQLIWGCLNPDSITRRNWLPVKVGSDGSLFVTVTEAGIDSGVATGGTVNTLTDNTKGWQVDIFEDAIVEILDISTGISYVRELDSNAADTLDFTTHPLPAAVVAGDTYSIRRVVSPLSPLAKAAIFNTALPGIGLDWLGADITPTNSPSFLRIYLTVAVAGTLSVTRTIGGVTVAEELNHGVDLVANSAYMFDVEWRSTDSLNFKYSATAANILVFRADEVSAAVA